MNKFRNNLHPAFFFDDDISVYKNEYYNSEEYKKYIANSDEAENFADQATLQEAADAADEVKEQVENESGEVKDEVERTYVEWYEAEILDWEEPSEEKEDMSDRKNRNFLSDDLPEYLWNIRKTPWVLKALSFLPIFSMKEDRPSKVDRKAIKYFLKYSSKINLEGNAEWKDKAVALLEAFHDNRLSFESTEEKYKEVLQAHWITVDEEYLDNIIKAGRFYISTQSENNSDRDQHAIYLSVLKIIESKWWAKIAVDKFKNLIEQAKKDKKTEKKEW